MPGHPAGLTRSAPAGGLAADDFTKPSLTPPVPRSPHAPPRVASPPGRPTQAATVRLRRAGGPYGGTPRTARAAVQLARASPSAWWVVAGGDLGSDDVGHG